MKKELLSISVSLAELESNSPPDLSISAIAESVDRYRADLDAGDAPGLKSVIGAFIDEILVSTDTITVRYKFEFHGALGQSRTAAFSSGG